MDMREVTSCKDSILALLSTIILIQTAEYNNLMLEWEQIHPFITLTTPRTHRRLYKYNIIS